METGPSSTRRTLVGGSFLVLNLVGIAGNAAVLGQLSPLPCHRNPTVILKRKWRRLSESTSFYCLMATLAFGDMCYLTTNLVVQTPLTLFGMRAPFE